MNILYVSKKYCFKKVSSGVFLVDKLSMLQFSRRAFQMQSDRKPKAMSPTQRKNISKKSLRYPVYFFGKYTRHTLSRQSNSSLEKALDFVYICIVYFSRTSEKANLGRFEAHNLPVYF